MKIVIPKGRTKTEIKLSVNTQRAEILEAFRTALVQAGYEMHPDETVYIGLREVTPNSLQAIAKANRNALDSQCYPGNVRYTG